MEEAASRSATRRLYDRIAEHFASTRSRPWEEVIRFVEETGTRRRAMDLGCGNGRHLPVLLAEVEEVVGVDASRGLMRVARSEHSGDRIAWVQADALSLPFRRNSFDVVLYIATIHHLPRRLDRITSLNELARVLSPDGRGMISAWSVSHEKFDDTVAHDRYVPWTLPSGESLNRFYHLYDLEEFGTDLARSNVDVERIFDAGGNCFGIVQGV